MMFIFCPKLQEVYVYSTVTITKSTLEDLSRLIAPHLKTVYAISRNCDG